MKRYAALLRGIGPTTAKMPDLVRAFEAAGFTDVRTVLGSGNVVFSARPASTDALERRAEAAMHAELGKAFYTIVRAIDEIEQLLASDPYSAFRLEPSTKRVVTFRREPPKPAPKLPVALENSRILTLKGREAFSAYVPDPGNPAFMALIEKTFGKNVTTRTWETLQKIVRAGSAQEVAKGASKKATSGRATKAANATSRAPKVGTKAQTPKVASTKARKSKARARDAG